MYRTTSASYYDTSGYHEDDDTTTGDETDEDEDLEDSDGGHARNGGEYTEIKEQMYQDKLAELKRQLRQLQDGVLPEYLKRLRRLESSYKERARVNQVVRDLEIEMVEQDFVNEKRASAREYEEHKVFLREQLVAELEEKQKMIEAERHSMELSGDSTELKPITTRKLRRRANEASSNSVYGGPGDKRRKPLTFSHSMNYQLEDGDILDDLKIINKNKAFSMSRFSSSGHNGPSRSSIASSPASTSHASLAGDDGPGGGFGSQECRVVDGKLFYDKRWFRRGQSIMVEPKQGEKYPAMISAIGSEALWVRKTLDGSKTRIYLSQITKGKIVIKRRAS